GRAGAARAGDRAERLSGGPLVHGGRSDCGVALLSARAAARISLSADRRDPARAGTRVLRRGRGPSGRRMDRRHVPAPPPGGGGRAGLLVERGGGQLVVPDDGRRLRDPAAGALSLRTLLHLAQVAAQLLDQRAGGLLELALLLGLGRGVEVGGPVDA